MTVIEDAGEVGLRASMAYLEHAGYEEAKVLYVAAVRKPEDDPTMHLGNSATMVAALGFEGPGEIFSILLMVLEDVAATIGVTLMVVDGPEARGQG